MPIGGQPFGTSSSPSGSSVDAITNLHGDVVADGPGDVAATIQPLAVTSGKLAANAVTDVKVAATAQIAHSKLADVATSGGAVLGAASPGDVVEVPHGVVARSIGAAADAAAARAVLGIGDMASFANDAIAEANSVCGFSVSPRVLVMDMNNKPGTLSSPWLTAGATGTGAISRVATGADVGARELTTGATAGGAMQLYAIEGADYCTPLISELIGTKWFVAFDFKVTTTVDANTQLAVGWNSLGLASGKPVLGVYGPSSTTKFRLHLMQSSTGANSTIDIDGNWHRCRMWSDGTAGTVYARVDGESAFSLTGLSAMGIVGPFFHTYHPTSSGAQSVRNRMCVYIVEGQI